MDFNVGEGPCEVPAKQVSRELRVTTKLRSRKEQLEEELSSIREVEEILTKNPDIERLLTLMGKLRI